MIAINVILQTTVCMGKPIGLKETDYTE